MTSQVEVSKITSYAAVAPPNNNVSVSKLVMYVMAIPGEGPDTSNRQGHVYSQIIRRD